MQSNKYDCIVIGGGITGAGIARDLSLRGLSVALLEKNDLSEGTTGRCHAMIHSGARYVYKDKEAATECATEAVTLFKIAPHITEPCGGFFMGVAPDEVEYGDKFAASCKVAGVPCEEIRPEEFLHEEPNCNPATQRVFRVNDGYVDPFLLTIYNAYDAQQHGAVVKTYCNATHLLLTGKQVIGVEYLNLLTCRKEQVLGQVVVNATGPWASFLEKDLTLASPLKIAPTMGTILVIQNRLVNHLINRLRPPGDGDILVPSHQSVLLGTTSMPVKFEQLNNLMPSRHEIETILQLGEILIPTIRNHHVIRFYSGARPLIASGGSSRDASRKFDIIDYESAGYSGLITIFGGKLTTYRLMAENVGDVVCRKLGKQAACETAKLPLPGGEQKVPLKQFERDLHVDEKTAFDMQYKWGTLYRNFLNVCQDCLDSFAPQGAPRTICECEHVTEPELAWVRQHLGVKIMDDYRRWTRQGMGPCQGLFCFYKLANLEAQWTDKSHSQILGEMKFALQERWKTEHIGDFTLKRQIKLAKYVYLMGGYLR